MATFTSNDSQRSISITTATGTLDEGTSPVPSLFLALVNLNSVAPIASVGYSGTALVITLKDSRVFTINFTISVNPTYQPVTSSSWADAEVALIRAVAVTIPPLVSGFGMSAMTVTYN